MTRDEQTTPSSMMEKIQGLMRTQEESLVYEQERILVAWVLMTRLSSKELEEVWTEFQTPLVQVAKRLLQEKNPDACYILYMRLISQVTSLLDNNYPCELGIILFDAYKSLETTELSEDLNVDVCSSLDVLIKQHGEQANPSNILETIWQTYTTIQQPKKQEETRPLDTSASEEDKSNYEWNLMKQTLRGILQHYQDWDKLVLYIFQTYGYQYLPESMLQEVLEWVRKSSKMQALPVELRSLWFEFFLQLIHSRVSDERTKKNDSFSKVSLRRSGFVDGLNQVLLAHIVSPVTDSESLRALAWETTVNIVDAYSWSWIVPKASTKSLGEKLGAHKHLCAWVRLASGEWRIQLQLESSEDGSQAMVQSNINTSIGVACARLLMNAVYFFVDLQEKAFQTSMTNDAMFHLRQSLEECLMTTVEYLNMSIGKSESAFSAIAIQLLGSLLREVDIWNLLNRDDSSIQAIINCIQSILPTLEDYFILPGLANILAAADSDSAKEEQLIHLWDPLVDYLIRFWIVTGKQSSTKTQIEEWGDLIFWACSCIELWVDTNNSSPTKSSNKARLQHRLIQFIKCMLEADLPKKRLQSYLSSAVGCYMTMSESHQKPNEEDAQVIFNALQFCES